MIELGNLIPRTALPHEVLRVALVALERGQRVVLASVISRQGSAPSTPGQKLCLLDDLTAVGTVGGGAVERAVLVDMARAIAEPDVAPKVDTFRLGPSLGMCCGGSVEVLIEPMSPPVHVLVVGAGHVGAFASPLLASLGFRVTLCDRRSEAAEPSRLAALPSSSSFGAEADTGCRSSSAGDQVRLLLAEHDDPEVTAALPRDLSGAAAVVMTHDHGLDQAVIEWALARGFGFVGGVGSRAKAARVRARLEAKGVPGGESARVRMPVGVDIGARTPAEIGVALAAELVAWRAGRWRARWPAVTAAAPAGQGAAELPDATALDPEPRAAAGQPSELSARRHLDDGAPPTSEQIEP
jgi:xanthine dehydrogenase accessory factor